MIPLYVYTKLKNSIDKLRHKVYNIDIIKKPIHIYKFRQKNAPKGSVKK